MSKTFKHLMPLLAMALLLSGCLSRTPSAKIYALPSTDAATAAQRGRITIALPIYLQRTQMRLFDAATGEVRSCKGGLWAAPLQDMLSDAFNLQLAGGTGNVVCTAFAPGFDGQFHASGRFSISRADGTHASGDFNFTLPPPAALPPLSPAALARQYADAVRRLAALMSGTSD